MEQSINSIAMRVMTDMVFAQKLLEKPEEVLRAEGITPTAEMIETLKGIDLQTIENMARSFNDENKAM